jgi:hypothetical protein
MMSRMSSGDVLSGCPGCPGWMSWMDVLDVLDVQDVLDVLDVDVLDVQMSTQDVFLNVEKSSKNSKLDENSGNELRVSDCSVDNNFLQTSTLKSFNDLARTGKTVHTMLVVLSRD